MSQLKKLERDMKFNADTFNKAYEEADALEQQEADALEQQEADALEQQMSASKSETPIIKEEVKSPDYMVDLGVNMKNLFFEILEMLLNKENPTWYIMEDEHKQFTFAMMIIMFGGIMLFLSNLMINNN